MFDSNDDVDFAKELEKVNPEYLPLVHAFLLLLKIRKAGNMEAAIDALKEIAGGSHE